LTYASFNTVTNNIIHSARHASPAVCIVQFAHADWNRFNPAFAGAFLKAKLRALLKWLQQQLLICLKVPSRHVVFRPFFVDFCAWLCF
jgi:hypothetical protein